jgi:hypothetical protein
MQRVGKKITKLEAFNAIQHTYIYKDLQESDKSALTKKRGNFTTSDE